LTGGRGGVVGTLLGVIFLGALANGMNLMGLPGYWQIFVQGIVLIAAVVLDKLVNRS
jgi:ribose/xylose/arabinose/galactoside ABC-type transport system permease subunit